jgi:hypothetical protein
MIHLDAGNAKTAGGGQQLITDQNGLALFNLEERLPHCVLLSGRTSKDAPHNGIPGLFHLMVAVIALSVIVDASDISKEIQVGDMLETTGPIRLNGNVFSAMSEPVNRSFELARNAAGGR